MANKLLTITGLIIEDHELPDSRGFDVLNESDSTSCSLQNTLFDLEGKRVKITIEVLEGDE